MTDAEKILVKALREIRKEAKKSKPDPDEIYYHAQNALDMTLNTKQ